MQNRVENIHYMDYIRSLETELQKEKDERNFVFNHPVLRILRGFRNVKAGRCLMGWNDIKVSSRQIFRGRTLKYSKVKRESVSTGVSIFDKQGMFDYPELFLHHLNNKRQVLLVGGKPESMNDIPACIVGPDDYSLHMSLHPKSILIVNLLDVLPCSEWAGLFSFNRMRLTKVFSNICRLAKIFDIEVIVLCNDFSRYPLLTEFSEVVTVKEALIPSDDEKPPRIVDQPVCSIQPGVTEHD